MPASQYLTAYRWVLYDAIRSKFTPTLARCRALEAQALFAAGRPVSACRHLAEASRLANSSYASEVRHRWRDFERAFPYLVAGDVSRETATVRSIVLRVPGRSAAGSWKGILLIKFTATFSYYFRNLDFQRLTRDYHVFLEPSWMGYCDPDILFWGQAGNPVFVEASEARDRKFLVDLNLNLVPVDFGSGDWVDDRVFRPLGGLAAVKSYDVTYVANRGPYKRAHVFFKAVSEAARVLPTLRAAFVCASWGGKRDDIRDLISYYKVQSQVDLLESLNQNGVNEVLNRSKVSVMLSRKEGSNRCVFESMFANTPVILLEENVGINKSYVNAATGRIVPEQHLVAGILDMARNYESFRPREWALQNISPQATRRKMVAAICARFPAEPLSEDDVRLKVNGPELRYYDHEFVDEHRGLVDRVLDSYARQ